MANFRNRWTRFLDELAGRNGAAASKGERNSARAPDQSADTEMDEIDAGPVHSHDRIHDEDETSEYLAQVFAHNEIYIRGWVASKRNTALRLRVAIFIDNEKVGIVTADDPRANLRDVLGGDDIHHGFEILIPQRFHDGAQHEITLAPEGIERLSLRRNFVVAAESVFPTLEIVEIRAAELSGAMRLPREIASGRGLVGIWVGDKRLPQASVKLTVFDSWDDVRRFNLALTKTNLAELIRSDARIAIDGAYEIGESIRLRDQFGLSAMRSWNNTVTVTSRLLIPHDLNLNLRVRIYRDAELKTLAAAARPDLSLGSDEIAVSNAEGCDLWVVFTYEGDGTPWQEPLRLTPRLGELISDSMFRDWTADGPRHWIKGEAIGTVFRSYHAFPQNIARRYRLSGDAITIELPANNREAAELLHQPIAREAAAQIGSNVSFAIAARSTAPVDVTLALADVAGIIAQAGGRINTNWSFVKKSATVQRRDGASDDLRLVVSAKGSSENPVWLEIGGIACGDEASFAVKPAPQSSAITGNLVENAKLTSWPNGLDFGKVVGRFETAQGWFVYNKQSKATPLVLLKPARRLRGRRNKAPGYALGFAADDVPSYCRLEIRLHDFQLERLAHYRLGFVAATEPFAHSGDERSRWGVIDKVFLLQRSSHSAEEGVEIRDARVAAIANHVLLTHEPDQFSFERWKDVRAEDGTPNSAAAISSEYFIVFEFAKPFSIDIQDVEVSDNPASDEASENTVLVFEDRGIEAQIPYLAEGGYLAGLKTPEDAGEITTRDEADSCRWSWRLAGMGSVEVVVCMHNAVEETLACLSSLCGTSSVPHTVTVVDDASSALSHGRVLEFIRDKPWMRLIRNEHNLGYTKSANRGIFASDADWAILLNSDTVVTRGWIEGLLECAASRPDIAGVGPLSNAATYQSIPEIYDANGKWCVNNLPTNRSLEEFAIFIRDNSLKAFPAVPLLNGFCTLLKRAIFVELGGLNEEAFPAGYGEENDLCTRFTKMGYRLCVADHVYVYHHKSASFGPDRRAELSKNGGKVLRELHPDVDFNALGRKFGDTAPLAHIRDRARAFYRS
jgi:GT2 family glycosyltransferase